MESDNDLDMKVHAWLQKTGYPLEMRVAAAIKKAGLSRNWELEPNLEYTDPQTGDVRETDFYLDLFHSLDHLALCFRLAIECKSTSHPWVIFKREHDREGQRARCLFDPFPNYTYYTERTSGQLTAYLIALVEHLQDRIHHYSAPGYAIAEAFKTANAKDAAHNAVRQALSAAIATSDDPSNFADVPGVSTTCPIVITTSPLFEASLAKDGQSVTARRVESTAVWISHRTRQKQTRVIICNEPHLPELVSDCKSFERHSGEFIRIANPQLIKPGDGAITVRID